VKKTNYIRKLLTYCSIWFVFWGSLLLPIPKDNIFFAEGGPLTEVTTPENSTTTNTDSVVNGGEISTDQTPSDSGTIVTQEQTEPDTTQIPETDATQVQSFQTTLDQGPTLQSISEFSGIRPIVTSIELMAYDSATWEAAVLDTVPPLDLTEPKDQSLDLRLAAGLSKYEPETDVEPNADNFLAAQDLTNVRLNSTIRIKIKEAGTLQNYSEPLIVLPATETDINKKIALRIVPNEAGEELTKVGDEYVITLSLPEGQTWSARTTFNAYINPEMKNDQGLNITPKSFKFTTRPEIHSVDIHGSLGMNTNSCANCHSTHNGDNANLIGGTIQDDQGEYLCMACHDGTVASAMPEYDSDAPHFQSHQNLKDEGESCASCHNPHTAWTKENPNKIKDKSGTVYNYKKSLGLPTDFNLCLRCHDGNKASNIKQFYEDPNLLYYSGHNITATDGSTAADGAPLKGQLACADCHETHGNPNTVYSLKGNLGNIKRNTEDIFPKTAGTEFTAEMERDFCTKCHFQPVDGAKKAIEMYGNTVEFDETLYGHRPIKDSSERCSFCHSPVISSDFKEELRATAHAPRKLDE
jgi:predicted CXXCH cytochrome family protein